MWCVQLLLMILTTSAWIGSSPTTTTRSVPSSCPVTLRPSVPSVPPPPFSNIAHPNAFWIGNNGLWSLVTHTDGIWPGPKQKVFWFDPAYDWLKESTPSLVLVGRRLDGEASAPSFTVNNGHRDDWGSFMVSLIHVPTAGCWEIKGTYKQDELSFIVWVQE